MAPEVLGHLEVWLVTGSQEMYGPATLRQVEAHAREVAAGLDAQPEIPVRVVHKEVAVSPGSIRRVALEANAAETLHRPDHLDAHLLARQDVDRRAERAAEAVRSICTRSSTATSPGPTIDMDFMNLNQSAHGDREFGFIGTRLRLRAQGRRRPLAGSRTCRPRSAPGCARPAAGTSSQRLKVARFGDNMREVAVTEGDKVEAQIQFGYSVNGYGVGDLVRASSTQVTDARDRPAAARIRGAVRRGASAAQGRRARGESLRDAARIELGMRAFLDERRLQGLHHHLRGPARPDAAARASPSSG